MQSSHARWEYLPPPANPQTATKLTKGISTLRLAGEEEENGAVERTQSSSPPPPQTSGTANGETENDSSDSRHESIFSAVPSSLTRHFAVNDIYYESPQYSNMGLPGPDGDAEDIGGNGLISIANPMHPEFVSQDVLAELPPQCKDALMQAATQEWEWKTKWHQETVDGNRIKPSKNYAWFP